MAPDFVAARDGLLGHRRFGRLRRFLGQPLQFGNEFIGAVVADFFGLLWTQAGFYRLGNRFQMLRTGRDDRNPIEAGRETLLHVLKLMANWGVDGDFNGQWLAAIPQYDIGGFVGLVLDLRSEEQTSEIQSPSLISYSVFFF